MYMCICVWDLVPATRPSCRCCIAYKSHIICHWEDNGKLFILCLHCSALWLCAPSDVQCTHLYSNDATVEENGPNKAFSAVYTARLHRQPIQSRKIWRHSCWEGWLRPTPGVYLWRLTWPVITPCLFSNTVPKFSLMLEPSAQGWSLIQGASGVHTATRSSQTPLKNNPRTISLISWVNPLLIPRKPQNNPSGTHTFYMFQCGCPKDEATWSCNPALFWAYELIVHWTHYSISNLSAFAHDITLPK